MKALQEKCYSAAWRTVLVVVFITTRASIHYFILLIIDDSVQGSGKCGVLGVIDFF